MCNIHALLTQSIICEVKETPDEDLTVKYVVDYLFESLIMFSSQSKRRERKVFKELLKIVPNLEECVMTGSEEDLADIADLVSTFPLFTVCNVSYLVASQRCDWGQRR